MSSRHRLNSRSELAPNNLLTHFCHVRTSGISLDLREDELAEDAVEAGLQGSFLRRRDLSRPFSLGEGNGVPRGEARSWCKDKD